MGGSVHGNCHRLRQRPAGDNSALNGRIVVMDMKTRRPLYLVHSPLGTNSWTVASAIEQAEIGDFPTLYAALSFVTPVRILHPIAALKATPSASEALKSLRGAGAGSEFGCSCHLWSAGRRPQSRHQGQMPNFVRPTREIAKQVRPPTGSVSMLYHNRSAAELIYQARLQKRASPANSRLAVRRDPTIGNNTDSGVRYDQIKLVARQTTDGKNASQVV